MAEVRFSLKDALFNAEKVAYLGGLLHGADRNFDRAGFEHDVMARLLALELKARIAHIAKVLAVYLPDDFAKAAALIQAALPPELDPSKTDDDFGDFIFAPFGAFVVAHGMGDVERSLDLLHALTRRFSMEDAIRYFINAHPDATLKRLERWAGDPNYHVRRLVSEGTRPKLPWCIGIDLEPGAAMPFLDRLHADPTRYVTRSVANHLNDISKTAPDLVIAALVRWRAEGRQAVKELDWMSRHALRTLIKQGHAGTMAYLGYSPDLPVAAQIALADAKPRIGGALEFAVKLTAEQDMPALVDYLLTFATPRGTRQKVFKLKSVDLAAAAPTRLEKRHPLKGGATTFTLHPGPHTLAVQVNGRLRASAEFDLLPEN